MERALTESYVSCQCIHFCLARFAARKKQSIREWLRTYTTHCLKRYRVEQRLWPIYTFVFTQDTLHIHFQEQRSLSTLGKNRACA